MSQNYFWPPSGGASSNPSIGSNGLTAPTSSTEVGGINPGGNLQPLQTDASGNLLVNINSENGAPFHVIVDSSALPTGASTSALQTSGNTSLSDIDTKTPALGQALAAGSVPVVLTAAQVTTLTPPTTVTVTQATGTNLHTVVDNFPATQPISGTVTANQGSAGASAWKVDGSAVTQPISAASLPLPTGAATSALQTTISGQLPTSLGSQSQANSLSTVLSKANNITFGPYATATAVINYDLLSGSTSGWYDVSQYTNMAVTIYTTTTITAGTITFETTDDTTNDASGITFNLQDESVLTQTNITSLALAASTVKRYRAPLSKRYIRFRMSVALTGTGTVGVTLTLKQGAYTPIVQGVVQTTAASLATTATIASGTVTAVTSITNALPSGTNNIGLVGTGGSTGVSNAPVQNLYGSTNITTAAYTQLIASTTSATNFLDIFDSSGQAMILATGAGGSEVILAYVAPGGDTIRVQIPASTRIAYKALSANATTGYLLMNLWK